MSAKTIPVDVFDLVVFGATGDLAYRKLFPSLYQRHKAGQIVGESRIIGASRREYSDEEFQAIVRDKLNEFVSKDDLIDETVNAFLERISYVALDVTTPPGWDALKTKLGENEDRVRAFYLSVGPALFAGICEQIGAYGLNTPNARVVVEKPIGRDLASSEEVNNAVGAVFKEEQIYRIDHYLGKETVQNLMALRFGNVLLEPLWNATYVDHVQITAAESIGVGNRVGYYNKSGAMRDMVQNHLLQLLCLTAMEAPSNMDADAVRDEKLKVLRALQPITPDNVGSNTVRGQYSAGASVEGAVPGYLEELGESSDTETFFAAKVEIGNWRWAGVPFYLRTGKRLPRRVSEIIVTFKQVPHSIFESAPGSVRPNKLIIRLQPDEGVKLFIMIKDPGPGGMRLRQVPLDMSFAETFDVRNPDAYERLLMDIIRGNATLFMRRDEVEAAWKWVDPILEAWAQGGTNPQQYTSGTWGPSASVALIERDGRTWHDEG